MKKLIVLLVIVMTSMSFTIQDAPPLKCHVWHLITHGSNAGEYDIKYLTIQAALTHIGHEGDWCHSRNCPF